MHILQHLFNRFCFLLILALRRIREAAYADVIDNLFDLFHIVFKSIKTFAQTIVFQIEQTKARVQITNEMGDIQGALVVAHCDGICGEAR